MSAPRPRRRWLRRGLAGAALVVVVAAAWFLAAFGRVAAGYAATMAAVQGFGTGDLAERILAERVRLPAGLGRFVSLELERRGDVASGRARVFGLFAAEARWRPGLGATRVVEGGAELPEALPDLVPPLDASVPWPLGASPELAELPPDVRAGVEAAIDRVFEADGAACGTHAVALAVDGRLVAERYREGYGRDTPLLGWSMTKSVTATLIGRLVLLGRLASLDAPAPVPEWQAPGDPRAAITTAELLRMRSGLAFFANYALPWSDSLQMLFRSDDFAAYAARKPLAHEPGTVWVYSDGTTNILARIARDHAGDTLEEAWLFPQRELFAPLRMATAVISVDPAGTWVGSSLMLASARDWARFGQLYADDGVFDGERLLPEGWVDLAAEATPESDHRAYGGAQLWRIDPELLRDVVGRPVPPSLGGVLYASGHDGQYVWIDRERRLVLVRLGILEPCFDPVAFLAEIVALF